MMHCMPWERIYYKSLKVAYLKTQCRRHWMKEGTVSSGVALRPRPTEVQPHFLGSKKFGIFFMFFKCHLYLTTSVTKLLLFSHLFLTTSVTKLLLFSHLFLTTSVTKLLKTKKQNKTKKNFFFFPIFFFFHFLVFKTFF